MIGGEYFVLLRDFGVGVEGEKVSYFGVVRLVFILGVWVGVGRGLMGFREFFLEGEGRLYILKGRERGRERFFSRGCCSWGWKNGFRFVGLGVELVV